MYNNFTIIVDTREQKPWSFDDHAVANHKLDTGDYSIQGLEGVLCIERKRNVAEIATNITETRFINVLERMKNIKYSFMLFEFNLEDIMRYPVGSNIPKKLWNKIKIPPGFIIKKLTDIQLDYNISIIFCGSSSNAEIIALSIMKKINKLENNHV